LFVDASAESVGINAPTPRGRLHIGGDLSSGATDAAAINLKQTSTTAATGIYLERSGERKGYYIYLGSGNDGLGFQRNNAGTKSDVMTLDRDGNLLVGTTTVNVGTSNTVSGLTYEPNGALQLCRESNPCAVFNIRGSDGTIVSFHAQGTQEGTISVSGTTVSYNGGHLSRWAQTLSAKDESLKKGTVLSNLDEMNVYVKPTLYWTEDDELPVDEEGNPTVAVGDVKEETSVSDNEQLNKVKVSDVEGDANVAGVFVNWTYDEAHQVDEINMAMTGDMIIRIAEGVTVARGDLLMSAGDGTAKPQGDDIVRSKTIAKVTSTHVTCTYEDGSYCVPCVLMAC
jgi:hypothetical protein